MSGGSALAVTMSVVAGLAGAMQVAVMVAGPRIGTAATVAVLIAGQLAMGAVIDQFGLFGLARIPVGPARAAGIVLLAVGAGLSLTRA